MCIVPICDPSFIWYLLILVSLATRTHVKSAYVVLYIGNLKFCILLEYRHVQRFTVAIMILRDTLTVLHDFMLPNVIFHILYPTKWKFMMVILFPRHKAAPVKIKNIGESIVYHRRDIITFHLIKILVIQFLWCIFSY